MPINENKMTKHRGLTILPCLDSLEMSATRRQELDIPRDVAAALGRSAVEAASNGFYFNAAGKKVELGELVTRVVSGKQSLPPDAMLPTPQPKAFAETRIQVINETTLGASLRLVEYGLRPVALNFANGIHPGGAFSAVPELKKRCFVDPALYTGRWLTTRCMRSTASAHGRTLLIGQSIHPMFRCSENTMERCWISLGSSASSLAPHRTHRKSDNLNPETCWRSVFIACYR